MLQYLAFEMHSQGQVAGREIKEQDLRAWLQGHLTKRGRKSVEEAESQVAEFIAVSRERGGLLEEQAGRYRFSHLSFQEFLTARYLAETVRDLAGIVKFIEEQGRAADSWWRETILLLVGYLNINDKDRASELAAVAFLEWGGSEVTQTALARRLATLLSDSAITDAPPSLRAAAGRNPGPPGRPA